MTRLDLSRRPFRAETDSGQVWLADAIILATGFAANIEFKPFGTLVNFVPRVSDDGDILLTVTPEVSEPDRLVFRRRQTGMTEGAGN